MNNPLLDRSRNALLHSLSLSDLKVPSHANSVASPDGVVVKFQRFDKNNQRPVKAQCNLGCEINVNYKMQMKGDKYYGKYVWN